ncbi:hypothetical protein M378DRAFT_369507 [Amanita muscaria Koide BX008]|uniref:Uncharacterized protein n=1 Tax=Amanita muscaria (strain Koide BX008) TaxID=946122 RepID=A0A0C2TI07_AMAMK|nr:hypothetical protein M378DRAFT_369507 [Amanita muscaria Koide BX008]
MSSENIKGIQQRLHELNAEESRLLADVQSKAENDRREREDKKPRTKQEKQRKQGKQGHARNEKRGAEEQLMRAEPSKRQRRRALKNANGQNSGPSNHGNQYQGQNQSLPYRKYVRLSTYIVEVVECVQFAKLWAVEA